MVAAKICKALKIYKHWGVGKGKPGTSSGKGGSTWHTASGVLDSALSTVTMHNNNRESSLLGGTE